VVEGLDGGGWILDLGGVLQRAATGDTQPGDLIFEGGSDELEVGDLEALKLAGVEAVFEGVGVSGLGAAFARGHERLLLRSIVRSEDERRSFDYGKERLRSELVNEMF
jgi:hypothetical protein